MDTSVISKFVDPTKIWEWIENFVHQLPSNKGYVLLGGIGVWTLYKFISNPVRFISIIRTIPRDFCALPTLILLKRNLRHFQNGNYTIFRVFEEIVKKNRNKIIFQFNDFKMTGKEVQELSYRVANYFASLGYKKGDRVGIFMTNCAEYAPIWLGLSRIGVIGALINTNLRQTPLKHCIESVNCKAVIFTLDLVDAMNELLAECGGQLEGEPTLYTFLEGGTSIPMTFYDSFKSLNEILVDVDTICPLVKEAIGFGDVAMFIFTSGTTGLPKAASIKHSRFLMLAATVVHIAGIKNSDIVYTPLPLYHGSGTVLGSGPALLYGACQVIRKKFSASNFWSDCIKYNATVSQYIGETCRYLLGQPVSKQDKQHKVRVMYGNGLRGEIWADFVSRFGVKISEFYGATEGNCNMVNLDGRVGAIGFVPLWGPNVLPIRLIKVDEETGEPIRDPKTGFVVRCGLNHPGEIVGRIIKKDPITDFQGYADKTSTSGKIMVDAFRKGDSWFRSGDVLVQDNLGYFYFQDRKGDTFRWKGENCSTAEVESIISTISGLKGTVVFGVEIPGANGRAGMAVMSDPENTLDMKELANGVIKGLPAYARPVFVRVLSTELVLTGTYKLKKNEYQKEAFNINLVPDPVYFFNGKKYVRMDQEIYEDIMSSKIRV
ncbi:long-chain fatty acid transport protein 4 [Folsomia candida]|uniref:long-chain fatty acid transport protein 4 n=1 Tax=Folsomia candida TaxID=158441 RepID=UPI001604A86A|nr:long-chain fatty acid transport protein 4 [Folsomia candida]